MKPKINYINNMQKKAFTAITKIKLYTKYLEEDVHSNYKITSMLLKGEERLVFRSCQRHDLAIEYFAEGAAL